MQSILQAVIISAIVVVAASSSNEHAASKTVAIDRELADHTPSIAVSSTSLFTKSYSMSDQPDVYTSGITVSDKNSAEVFIARNFAQSVHKIIMEVSGKDLPIDFQFDAGGAGDRNGRMPVKYIDKCVQVNTGPSDLITSLVTAKNEHQINKALKNDFTKMVENLEPLESGAGGGSGSGFQVYLKGVEVLSVGAGGGGGYDKETSEGNLVLGRGSGGGSQIIIHLREIVTSKSSKSRDEINFMSKTGKSKSRKLFTTDQLINIGGGQGLEDGKLEFSFDEKYHPRAYVKQLQYLRKILFDANTNEIAVLGGGGGGGAGCGPDGNETKGGGYGFGFQIGTPEAIEQAKSVAGGTGNGCFDMSYLSEQEQNEPWAINQRKYMEKYASF